MDYYSLQGNQTFIKIYFHHVKYTPRIQSKWNQKQKRDVNTPKIYIVLFEWHSHVVQINHN